MKKTIEVTLLPEDATGSYLDNSDCSLSRALRRAFPGKDICAFTYGALIGKKDDFFENLKKVEARYYITSIKAFRGEQLIEGLSDQSNRPNWLGRQHAALENREITKAIITLEKLT